MLADEEETGSGELDVGCLRDPCVDRESSGSRTNSACYLIVFLCVLCLRACFGVGLVWCLLFSVGRFAFFGELGGLNFERGWGI